MDKDNEKELFYDDLSHRYFRSFEEEIMSVVNNIRSNLLNGFEMFITVNDWYTMVGLPTVIMMDYFGWSYDNIPSIEIQERPINDILCKVIIHQTQPTIYGVRAY